jgi:hypothetical protein
MPEASSDDLPLPPNVGAFVQKVQQAAFATIVPASTVIYAPRSEKERATPGVAGSGVFLTIAEEHFLLTAAHVAEIGTKYGFGLYVPPGVPGTKLISLGDTTVYASESGSAPEDVLDIAAVHLLPETVPVLKKGHKFVRLQHLDHKDPGTQDVAYVVFGYPQAHMKHTPARKAVATPPLPYQSMIYDGSRGFPPNYDASKHLLLDFQLDENHSNSGKKVSAPDPEGMSGCGIWRMFSFRRGMSSWNSDEIRLVGIEHGRWKSYNVLKGTRIAWAIEAIYRNCPKLRPSIELNWGTSWRPN